MKSLILLLFVFVSCGGRNANERTKTFNGAELTIEEIQINDTFMINNSYESGIGVARVMPSSIGIQAQQTSATGVDTLPKIVRTSSGYGGVGGKILFTIETDILPAIKWVEIDSFTTRYSEFIITDSTGWVAKRDSAGKWHIKDAARALEIMYEGLIYDRRRPTKK